jgi:hypothetical protein
MHECYKCGCVVPSGAGLRREVKTGHSNRIYVSRRVSSSSGSSYGMRTLCARCARDFDAGKRVRAIVGVIVLFVLVAGGLFGEKNRPSSTSASMAYVPSGSEVSSAGVGVNRHRVIHSYSAPITLTETFTDTRELWVLNTDVTALTDAGGTRELHAGRPIRVTGKAAHRLRIRLHDGTTAYLPADMATYKSNWE